MSAAPAETLQVATCGSCGSRSTELRRKLARNGTLMLGYQCLVCGGVVGTWVKRSSVGNPDALPLWDDLLTEAFQTDQRVVWAAERRTEDVVWRRRYESHLASPKWRSIRARVMQRARGVCEGCGTADATEVHHLTYKHLGDELLFELVALCSECHEKAHDRVESQ
jgi:5-methylcytosine-specific restriction endonuclease McrA